MPLQFVKSERGKNQLVHDGYRFVVDKVGVTKTTWNFVERRRNKCISRIHTDADQIMFHRNEHNHTPNPAATEAKIILSNVKDSSIITADTPLGIVAAETADVSSSVAAALPSVRAMKQIVQRKRRSINYPLALPTSAVTLEIPELYKKSLGDENFLLFDSGATQGRILIFGTNRNLEMMASSTNWFADGTFNVAPNLFEQVYTIHGIRQSDVIPLIFALLPDKTERTYVRLLTALKGINLHLNPQTIMMDFERASVNAFRSTFPNASMSGCFFHFGQCLWRRLHRFPDLELEYKHNPAFATKVKCLTALAFVPPEDVVEAFEVLAANPFFSSSANMMSFMDYFEDTWIGQPRRRSRRRDPLFPIGLWNCYRRVAEDIAKTNNSVEGWHRGFHCMLGGDHPTIWRLIDGFKKEQSLNELRMQQYMSGLAPPPPRKRYRDSADRLKHVVQNYGNSSIIDYLEGIAHNLNIAV